MNTKSRHKPGLHLAAILLLIFVVGCETDDSVDPDFEEGSGTISDPFLIETAEDLNNVREWPDKHYKQVADIDLNDFADGSGWEPIEDETGNYKNYSTPVAGMGDMLELCSKKG
ncbi:MAG: hypothetical protein ACQESQ_12100 [Bacteroidota bacterium]